MSQAAHPGAHRFAVIGDGGTGDGKQRAVVTQLRGTMDQTPFSDLLLLGDNVYVRGEPEKFERALGRPYRPLVKKGVRLLPVLGNHDAFTRRGYPQLAYLGLGRSRYYKTELAGGKVDLFALDTTVFVDDVYIYRSEREQQWRHEQAEKQLAWLDGALAASTAEYKIVIGHHPLYSSGTRQLERFQLRTALGDTLSDHGVSAYLAGHQHIYERRVPKKGVTHFVSGGGGRPAYLLGGRGRVPRVHHLENHFMLFELTDAGLGFQTIAADGDVIDRGVIPPAG